MMTPIRVRGKKRAQNSCRELYPTYERRSNLHSSRVSKQHRLPLSEIMPSRTSQTNSARAPSFLERLPTELIQKIFFDCLNINLPRASPIIASVLSSFYVKSHLFFKVFSTTDFKDHVKEDLEAELAQLQTSILQLRWMTLDFFHQCIPTYLEKELRSQCKILQMEAKYGRPTGSLTPTTGGYAGYFHTKKWRCFGTEGVFVAMGLPDGWMSFHRPYNCSQWLKGRLLRCMGECRIPEKLLRGPWTNARCDFLETMLKGGATIDWVNSTSGEVAELGFQDALEEHNLRAVEILTREFVQPITFRQDLSWSFTKFGPGAFSPTGLGFKPSKKHLIMAAISYDCPMEIFESVVMKVGPMMLDYKNPTDRPLFIWAQQRSKEGDLRGHCLLECFRRGGILRVFPEWRTKGS